MVSPTITHYYNAGTQAVPSWATSSGVGGFTQVLFTHELEANVVIPGAGTDYSSEIWMDATVDDECCAGDDLETANAIDLVMAWLMVNNDSANPFTTCRWTIWDNNDETGTTKDITDTADTTVFMQAACPGYINGVPGVGAYQDGGVWAWTTVGGATKVTMTGSGTAGQVTDGYSVVFTENVGVTSTAVPSNNQHYGTLSYEWT